MEQALEMMLYECNNCLNWGLIILAIGALITIVCAIITKKTDGDPFPLMGCVLGVSLVIIGCMLFGCAKYNIRKIEMYPEAAYYEYYRRDIDVNIKYPTN